MANSRDEKTPKSTGSRKETSPMSVQSYSLKPAENRELAEIRKGPRLSPALSPRRITQRKEITEQSDEFDPLNPVSKDREATGKYSPLTLLSSESNLQPRNAMSPGFSSSNNHSINSCSRGHSKSRFAAKTILPLETRARHYMSRILIALMILICGGFVTFYEQYYIEGLFDPKVELLGFQSKTVGSIAEDRKEIIQSLEGFEPDSLLSDQTIDDLNENSLSLCGMNAMEIRKIAHQTNKSFIAMDHPKFSSFRDSMDALKATIWLAYLSDLVVVLPSQLSHKKTFLTGRKLLFHATPAKSSKTISQPKSGLGSMNQFDLGSIHKLHNFDKDAFIEELSCKFETPIVAKEPEEPLLQRMNLFSEENAWDLEHFLTIVNAQKRNRVLSTFLLSKEQLDIVANFHMKLPQAEKLFSMAGQGSRGGGSLFALEGELPFMDYEFGEDDSSHFYNNNNNRRQPNEVADEDLQEGSFPEGPKLKARVVSHKKGKNGGGGKVKRSSKQKQRKLGLRFKKLPEYLNVESMVDDVVEEDFAYLNEEDDSWASPWLLEAVKNPSVHPGVLGLRSRRMLKSIVSSLAANDV